MDSVQSQDCRGLYWYEISLDLIQNVFDKKSLDIGDGYWYGGPEELVQHFPLRRENMRKRTAYLPGDMLQDQEKFFGGVTEPVWINSLGGGLVVEEEQPLFYSWNEDNNGLLCLSSEHTQPYVNILRDN